jgi:hypothetical protein
MNMRQARQSFTCIGADNYAVHPKEHCISRERRDIPLVLTLSDACQNPPCHTEAINYSTSTRVLYKLMYCTANNYEYLLYKLASY